MSKFTDRSAFVADFRQQSVEVQHLDPKRFPFQAFNFTDPRNDATPTLTLITPWQFEVESNLTVGGNLAVTGTSTFTGAVTLTAAPTLSALTASQAVFTDASKGLVSNAITGTGNVVMSTSPTLTGTVSLAALTASGVVTLSGLTASQAIFTNASKQLVSNAITGSENVVMSASPTLTGTVTLAALTASSTITLNGLTASQAVFTNGSKQLISNAITGTGNVVMSASPTLTGTLTGEAATFSGTLTGVLADDIVTAASMHPDALRWPEDAEAYWPFDEGVKYPDNAAGTTYIQDAWATVDSWTTIRCTLDVATTPGKLRVTATDANPGIQRLFTGLSGKVIFARIKKVSSAATHARFYRSGPTWNVDIAYGDETEKTFLCPIPAGESEFDVIYPGGSGHGAVSGDIFEIDFIYIGTGAYDTKVTDVKGGIEGTLSGGVAFVDGPAGGAIDLNGTSAYMVVGDAPALNPPELSLFCVLKLGELDVAQQIFAKRTTTLAGHHWVYIHTDNKVYFDTFVGGNRDRFISASAVPAGMLGEWVLFGVTYDGTNKSIYIGGELFETKVSTEPGDLDISAADFFIGRDSSASQYFLQAAIAEPRIYSRALTEAEIKSLTMFVRPGRGMVVADQLYIPPVYIDQVNDRVGIDNAAPGATLHVGGTDGIIVPIGTTAQRVATQGMMRYNTTTSKFEGYDGTAWRDFH